MTVPFQTIADTRVPLFYAEINASKANTAVPVQRSLILGQKTSTGAGIIDSVVKVSNTDDAVNQAGPNSMLAQMVDDYRLNDPDGELWLGLLHDDGVAGVKATATITFNTAPTATGVFTTYIGGRRYQVKCTSTMTVTDVAAALVAVVNKDKRSTVTATNLAGVVTLTADNAGPHGNDCPINNYWGGSDAGEFVVPGLTTTVVQFASGAGAPDLTNVLGNCGDRTFDFVVSPYTDSVSMNALQTFMNDTTGRWAWNEQLYGHVFGAVAKGLGQLVTFGDGRNNQHESMMGWNGANTPAWRLAAAYAGSAAASLRIDPALPLQTLVVQGMYPPKKENRFQQTDRDQLLHNGISTFTVGDDGTMRIERVITTYQTNAFGQADNSYLSVETMYTLMAVVRRLKGAVTTAFARKKLAASGTRTSDPNVVTPAIIRGFIIAEYAQMEDEGLVQGSDLFAANLIVEQNATNPNRVDVLWPGTLIDQLNVLATLIQFRLSTVGQ